MNLNAQKTNLIMEKAKKRLEKKRFKELKKEISQGISSAAYSGKNYYVHQTANSERFITEELRQCFKEAGFKVSDEYILGGWHHWRIEWENLS